MDPRCTTTYTWSKLTFIVSALLTALLLSALLSAAPWGVSAQEMQEDAPTNAFFTRASPNRVLSFPNDHGSHPQFETEWWYFTGQLFPEGTTVFKDPAPLGFQLTFFRRASRDATGGRAQLFLAHAALSEHQLPRFTFERRLSRSMLGLAGAASGRLSVWNQDWRAEMIGNSILLEYSVPDEAAGGPAGDSAKPSGMSSSSSDSNRSERVLIKLIADAQARPVVQGANGYSAKASCEGCASHYYSMPGMSVTGSIFRGAGETRVSGLAWMDHEFMSNALTPNQQGWDWFSLSHRDGRHFMLFHLRNHSGGIDFGSGSVISDATARTLSRNDFSIEPLATWTSPKSGAQYPARWRITIPSEEIDVTLVPRSPNQELYWGSRQEPPEDTAPAQNGTSPDSLAYWEGAVSNKDQSVMGYVEMTGYSDSVGDLL